MEILCSAILLHGQHSERETFLSHTHIHNHFDTGTLYIYKPGSLAFKAHRVALTVTMLTKGVNEMVTIK